MSHRKRKKLVVNYKLQGTLAVKVSFYWFCYLLSVALIIFSWRLIGGEPGNSAGHFDAVLEQLKPVAFASVILLPMIIMDVLRWSNRFAGPAFRLNRALDDLAAGREVDRIKFRDADFWQEAAESFNTIAQRLDRLKTEPRAEVEVEADEQLCAV